MKVDKSPKNPVASDGTLSEEASPARSFILDLEQLRETLQLPARAYVDRLQAEIDVLGAWARERTKDPEVSKATIRDLRDMLALIRTLEIKPAKGRRKDLKKIDSVIEDLRNR